ncbi:hypothetical protein TLA_TLA_01148 [Tessaracoccus lapidicaptus]|nr:hypothetical protein TLA_TLA_01148 [Tessaracoccus lapidicaptus]
MGRMEAKRAADGASVTRSRRRLSPAVLVAIAVVTALLAAGGYLAWQVYGTTWLARDRAAGTVAELRASWAAATPTPTPTPDAPDADPQVPVPALPEPGEAAWILRIPSLGVEWPVVSGVEGRLLTEAVGWYPSTALPGQVGNTAIAGLRLTNGAPFERLLELREGDEVIIDTATATFTYRIVLAPAELTVQADESWVLDPVPGEPDTVPSQALLTLTTHEDLIDTPDRSVGFGVLEKAETTR